MKKILILGANSYIGTSFENYIQQKYPDDYEIHTTSLHGDAWQQEDWSGYDSILNATGKAHADIAQLSEAQKQEYYTVNCGLAVEAAKRPSQTALHSISTSVASSSTVTAATAEPP